MDETTLLPSTALMLKQLSGWLGRHGNRMLVQHELTVAQFHLLLALNELPESERTMKTIGKKFMLAQSAVVGLVQRMEKKGLITLVQRQDDRRSKTLVLTEEAIVLCHEARADLRLAQEDLLSCLTAPERDELNRLLGKLCASVRNNP